MSLKILIPLSSSPVTCTLEIAGRSRPLPAETASSHTTETEGVLQRKTFTLENKGIHRTKRVDLDEGVLLMPDACYSVTLRIDSIEPPVSKTGHQRNHRCRDGQLNCRDQRNQGSQQSSDATSNPVKIQKISQISRLKDHVKKCSK